MAHQDCRHLLGDLSDYLDGAAPAEVCAEIERHLTDCQDCRVVVDTLRKTVLLYRGQPQPGLTRAAQARLYRSLDLAEFLPPKTD